MGARSLNEQVQDHRDTMVQLAKDRGWKRGVELGVGSGLLFERFLLMGINMVGVDLGARPDRKLKVQGLGAFVHWVSTAEAAGMVEDGWADFVFIDAAHSYEAVKTDIALWLPKVRPGGWFGGHDYHAAFAGVKRAVDEAFGPQLVLLPGYIWARADAPIADV
jgi:hypothetical protein